MGRAVGVRIRVRKHLPHLIGTAIAAVGAVGIVGIFVSQAGNAAQRRVSSYALHRLRVLHGAKQTGGACAHVPTELQLPVAVAVAHVVVDGLELHKQ